MAAKDGYSRASVDNGSLCFGDEMDLEPVEKVIYFFPLQLRTEIEFGRVRRVFRQLSARLR